MHELTITPLGHLLIRESTTDSSGRSVSKGMIDAYTGGTARGLLYSATRELDAMLPPSFEFARSIARRYFTNLCKAVISDNGGSMPEIIPPLAQLSQAVLSPRRGGRQVMFASMPVHLMAAGLPSWLFVTDVYLAVR